MDGIIFVDFDEGKWGCAGWIVGNLCHEINVHSFGPGGVLLVGRDGERFSSEGLGWFVCWG